MEKTLTASHSPAQFKRAMAKLKQVAEEQLAANDGDRRFADRVENVKAQARFLAPVASDVTGAVSDNREHPETFLAQLFEPAALELLLSKCRNAYWFWFVIAKIDTRVFPVTAYAVARALARSKDAIVDKRYGFNWIETVSLEWQLKQLPPGFVIEMWQTGRLLAEASGFGEYRVLLNPLLVDD